MSKKSADAGAAERQEIIALDTSAIIALLCGWHEQHNHIESYLEKRLDAGAALVVPAPALIEAYSVMTRLPGSQRIAPQNALELLQTNFRELARVVALTAADYWTLLDGAPASQIYGGHTYDAVIMACARKADANTLLTFNPKHFLPLSDGAIRVLSVLI